MQRIVVKIKLWKSAFLGFRTQFDQSACISALIRKSLQQRSNSQS